MKYKGDDIKRLIPQRNPFIMVDEFEERDGESAATSLTVRPDNYFIQLDGTLSESGLIEHIAQSCSALAGYHAVAQQSEDIPVGIIGEVKRFVCHRRPKNGEKIRTIVIFDFSFGNVTLATGRCQVDGQLIAEAKLKIFVQ